MKRATQAQHTRRLNTAVGLLADQAAPGCAAMKLATRCGLSLRQAYRYVRRAQGCPQLLPVPEAKRVFTVKLPQSLIRKVRQQARRRDQPISQWVGQALGRFLEAEHSHG